MMRDVRQATGVFFALLALVAQLTLAVAVPAPILSLADATVLCHQDGNPGAPPAPAHQMPDCLLCFVCHGASVQLGLLATQPMLPAPATLRIAPAVVLPPATAPPSHFTIAARPRGPPVLT